MKFDIIIIRPGPGGYVAAMRGGDRASLPATDGSI